MNADNIYVKDKNIKNIFLHFCNTVITVIMIVFTGYLFLLSIFGTSMVNPYTGAGYETTVYLTDSPVFHIASIMLIFLMGYLAFSHLHLPSKRLINRLLLTVHIIMAVIMIISVFIYVYYPVWDQLNLINATNSLLNSDYSSWYFPGFNYTYPRLNPLTLLLVPFIYLFELHGGIIAFRLFNILLFFFASYCFYGFCKEVKLNGVLTSLLFILYLPMELFVFYIYGNIASVSLSLCAVWMTVRYLNYHHLKDVLFCAAAIVVGLFFKDTVIITLIAILIVFVLHGMIDFQWKNMIWIPIFIFSVVLFMFCNVMINLLIENITGNSVPSGMSPFGHITMGISEGSRANGWYNDYTNDTLAACNYDYDLYKATAKEDFRQRFDFLLSHPSYTISFFAKKTASQWNNPTFESTWILQDMLLKTKVTYNISCIPSSLFVGGSTTNMIYNFIYNLMQSVILFGSLCFFIFESRKVPFTALLPAIIFIGGNIFLLFWEAKAQYTVLFFIMLFPYAITGLISLFKGIMVTPKLTSKKHWYQSKEIIFIGVLLIIIILLSVSNSNIINATIRFGADDEYYNECLEQNVELYNQIFQN